jgi:hypothetical protein
MIGGWGQRGCALVGLMKEYGAEQWNDGEEGDKGPGSGMVL